MNGGTEHSLGEPVFHQASLNCFYILIHSINTIHSKHIIAIEHGTAIVYSKNVHARATLNK